MKYLLTVALLFVSGIAMAAGYVGQDKYGTVSQQFMPSLFGSASSTKAVMTIDTTAAHVVQFKTSAACGVKINGAGTSWTTAANTVEIQGIPNGVTSLVFTPISSATPTTLQYKVQ